MMPKRIYCVLGYACNNNCLLCAVDAEKKKNLSIGKKEIFGLLERLKGPQTVDIEISGGEPTCRQELIIFLEELKKLRNVRCILLTNGRNFANISLAEKISELNLFSTLIPVHGDVPEVHDRITQAPGSFAETIQGIRNLYDCNMRVGLKTIVNGLNYKRLPLLVEMIAKTFPECPNFSINGLDVQGKALENIDTIGVRITDAAPYIEKAMDNAEKYGLNLKAYSIPPCLLGAKYRKYLGKKHRSKVTAKTPTTDMEDVELTYGTVEKCTGCSLFEKCTGTWHTYFDHYGTGELKPVR